MILKNKVDFAVVFSVENANPNGDPLDGNRPRIDFGGYGEVTGVCIKRKIRNRLQDIGEPIFVQDNSRVDDGFYSLKERLNSHPDIKKILDDKKIDHKEKERAACEAWTDIRFFGQVLPAKGNGVTLGVRGPVSICHARSIEPIDIKDIQVTKSTNLDAVDDGRKDSSTMGMRYIVSRGAYVAYGSIFPQLAQQTGFSSDDAEKLKFALTTLFENDASDIRPSGSMNVITVYWWEQDCKKKQLPSGRVHKSLKLTPTERFPFVEQEIEPLDNLDPQIINMF